MNKHLFAAISFLYLFSATAIAENSTNAAEGFSYDYIDVSLIRYDLDTATSKANYDGYSVYISKSLSNNVHLLGHYMDLEWASASQNLDFTGAGIGVNYPINNSTDILIDYLHYKWKAASNDLTPSSTTGKINSLEPKIRHQFTDDIELNAGLVRIDFAGSTTIYKGFKAGGIYRINNDLSLKFEASRAERSPSPLDMDSKEFGIRYNF